MPRSTPEKKRQTAPPMWLMLLLMVAVAAVLVAMFLRQGTPAAVQAAESSETVAEAPTPTQEPTPTPTPTPTPEPTPEPTPTPTPEPDWSLPVPEGEPVDQDEWFSDAVFIGDSRTDGLHLFSGITDQADFLYSTGITVFGVLNESKVIRQGDKKVSILEALGQKEYGKVYVSLGVNELGGTSAEEFSEAYAQLIDKIRELQPNARLYIQSIIPVNTAKCKANDQRPYVTNENIARFNAVLAQLAQDKKVPLVNVSEALIDEDGEVFSDLSADGVHFKKEGYKIWLDYLANHTGA